jgi:PAS domain S-box-containing protein
VAAAGTAAAVTLLDALHGRPLSRAGTDLDAGSFPGGSAADPEMTATGIPAMHGATRQDRAAASIVSLALEESLRSRDGLLEWLPIGIYACDRDGLLVQYNRRAAELWGRSPGLGDPRFRFCGAFKAYTSDGEPLPPSAAPMSELLRTGRPIRNREFVVERPDGTRIVILANLEPLLGSDGEIVGGVSCFQDITERKRAGEAAVEHERRFGELLRALPAAIYTTDAAGRITFYNQAAVDLWGRRPDLVDERWCGSWHLYAPDGTPMPHDTCPMAKALKENRPLRDAEAVAERPDGTRVPFLAYPTPLRDASGGLVGAVNMLVDITQRKRAEDTQKLLMGELNHRVKNTLATVQAIACQTLQQARDPGDFVPSFSGRLQALARAHALLTQSTWRGADLMALLREQLLLDASDGDRITCRGPAVVLAPQMALHLAMVIHELGTNARKHGALSMPLGRLEVGWAVETVQGNRTLRLRWAESGGPPVAASSRAGFGTTLIEQSMQAHGGETRLVSEANGLVWEIGLPLPRLSAQDRGDPIAAGLPEATSPQHGTPPADGHADLAGRRILVVEDEPILALDIAGSLAGAGIEVLGPAATVAEALALIEGAALDGALLDANLDGQRVDEIAAALTRQSIPFAFVTGYGQESLPCAFRGAAIVAKPFSAEHLIQAARAFASPAAADILPIRGRTGAA